MPLIEDQNKQLALKFYKLKITFFSYGRALEGHLKKRY